MINRKSEHQLRVEAFMLRVSKLSGSQQEVPLVPTEPSAEVRKLRAKLILEEALETITALGVGASIHFENQYFILNRGDGKIGFTTQDTSKKDYLSFAPKYLPFNLAEVIDGCCDIAVVTTGTLSACGIPDLPFQELVDNNNLAKFGPGCSVREDGKLIKPPGHQPPDIQGMLEQLLQRGVQEDWGYYFGLDGYNHELATEIQQLFNQSRGADGHNLPYAIHQAKLNLFNAVLMVLRSLRYLVRVVK